MQAVIAIFLMALAATSLGTPWVRRLALELGFVDAPASRKLHQEAMPLLGGLAIIGGTVLAVLAFTYVAYGRIPPSIAGVLLAAGVVAATGLIDDRLGLPAWVKLAGQFLGFLILLRFGIRVQLPVPEALNLAITFLWLAGIANALNFLDNMDGLSAGVSAVAAAFILLLATIGDQVLVAGLSAAILGACLGFLRFNFPPAQIFMGDTGSLFLGFLLAVLALQLRFPENSSFVTWMVPLFILGVPIFDMALVTISRIRRGVSPNTAGRDHTSHRLNVAGFTQRETVLILYLLGGVLGLVGVFVTQATVLEGYFMGFVTAALGLWAIWRLDRRPINLQTGTAPHDKQPD